MSTAAGLGAGIALGAAMNKKTNQEENLTYTKKDLEGWEFKILRSNTASFKKEEELKKVLEEESRAGWELVEKFDDHRLRFKRRVKDRGKGDGAIDPYRSIYGISTWSYIFILFAIGFLFTIVFLLLFGILFMGIIPFFALNFVF